MFRPGQQTQASGSVSEQGQSRERLSYGEQEISNGVALKFINAFIDQTGEDVTLLAACNWAGHSPANIGVDSRGKQFVASFEEVTVADARAVPNLQLTEIRQRQTQIRQRMGVTPTRQLQNQ